MEGGSFMGPLLTNLEVLVNGQLVDVTETSFRRRAVAMPPWRRAIGIF